MRHPPLFILSLLSEDCQVKLLSFLLSPDYLAIRKNLKEWNTTFGHDRLIPVLVRKCGPKHTKFLQSLVYIDLSECEETIAQQLLLAGVQHDRAGKKPVLPPPFPGQWHKPATEDYPPFPALQSVRDHREFAQQIIPLIRAAFARKDWSDVLQKTSSLLNPEAAHTLSPELYHLHGSALFEVGEVEKAGTALETALGLETDEEKRLTILQDYTNILMILGRWTEVLSYANTVLQQIPGDFHWIALRQQALSHTESKLQSLISVPQGVEVFFSYSHKDKVLLDELEKYLSNLKRQRVIIAWHDGEIDAGGEWDNEIKEHIDRAHIIRVSRQREQNAPRHRLHNVLDSSYYIDRK